MTPRARSFLVASSFAFISVLVAGVAAYGVFVVLGNYQQALTEAAGVAPEEILVLTAARDLPMGHTIQEADLVMSELRSAYVVPTAVRRLEDIVGRVAGERILVGDLIRLERLAPAEAGHDLDAIIATGMRARSVNMSGASQISGFLEPGNRVDVIVTLYDDNTGEVAETTTLVQAVRVLAVDDRTAESAERGIKLKPQVTLELAPDDAERLTHAKSSGDVRLTLRGDIDFNYEVTGGADTSMLLGGTDGAIRVTIAELREAVGRDEVSVVKIIQGRSETTETFP